MAGKHSETSTEKSKDSTKNAEDTAAQVAFIEAEPTNSTDGQPPETLRQDAVNNDNPDDGKAVSDVPLQLEEFKIYVDLYKYFLRISLSVIIFFLTVVGGIMTIIFRPAHDAPGKQVVDTLIRPAKSMFFTTPFIISCVLTLTFAVGAAYWGYSTKLVNQRIRSKHVEVELVTRPFFHLLTLLLIVFALLLAFVTYQLGRILAHYGILFCPGC
jgi:hypothetical protein